MTADLIARLEKATGPDRQLDIHIGATTGLIWNDLKEAQLQYLIGEIKNEKTWAEAGSQGRLESCPCYTASIDAALMLVPEDCYLIELRNIAPNDWYASVGSMGDDHFKEDGEANTAALATCIAGAKAHLALKTAEREP